MRTSKLMTAAAAALLVLAAPALQAADAAGTVLFTSGKLTATGSDGKSRELQRRGAVYAGDKLSTGSARAQVRFTDGSIVALKPGSELRLDSYAYGGNGGSNESVMSLLKGGFRTLTGAISQLNREAYKVNTPVATIGVRGTLYEASLGDNGLNLGVWDGGITACGEGGCIDLGMNADFRFGFVPLEGAPQGTREAPEGVGDEGAGNDGTTIGDGDTRLSRTDVETRDLQGEGLFGPSRTVTRVDYPKVGYALVYGDESGHGGGVIKASYARAEVDGEYSYTYVTGWALVDDASGIEISSGQQYPPDCDCSNWGAWSNDGGQSIEGGWSRANLGLSAGDPNPMSLHNAGEFVMGDYISPAAVHSWGQEYLSLSANLQGAAVENGQNYQNIIGSINVDFQGGYVWGSLNTDGYTGNTWYLNFDGQVSGGKLSNLALNPYSQYLTDTQSWVSVTGHIDASFIAQGSGIGVVGGVTAQGLEANPDTNQVDRLDGVFITVPYSGGGGQIDQGG